MTLQPEPSTPKALQEQQTPGYSSTICRFHLEIFALFCNPTTPAGLPRARGGGDSDRRAGAEATAVDAHGDQVVHGGVFVALALDFANEVRADTMDAH